MKRHEKYIELIVVAWNSEKITKASHDAIGPEKNKTTRGLNLYDFSPKKCAKSHYSVTYSNSSYSNFISKMRWN